MTSIVEKIKKIRAKQQNEACTAEESASYAGIIQNLIFQHNIEEEQLLDKEHIPFYDKENFDLGVKSTTMKKWRASLIHAIATFNFCRVFNYQDSSYVTLVGQEENREAVKFLYTVLEKQLITAQKNALKNVYYNKGEFTKSFYIGAANTIYVRLEEQYNRNMNTSNEASKGSGSALAIKVDNALTNAVNALVGQTREPRKRKTKILSEGYAQGSLAARNAELNQRLQVKRTALTG